MRLDKLSHSQVELSTAIESIPGLLCVGGREQNSRLPYCSQHPLIVHGKHPLTKILVRSEHLCLLHAGQLLLSSSLSRRFHRSVIRSITRNCVTCRRKSKPSSQMMGQLPMERVSPDAESEWTTLDQSIPSVVLLVNPPSAYSFRCL
jgi:hypothetical protein